MVVPTGCCRITVRPGWQSVAVNAPLVLLDSASLYFRAFFALPESMKAASGQPVNAVRGFADMVAKIIVDRGPGRLVACMDADWRPQFRVDAIPSYKAQRVADEAVNAEEVPDTLGPQVPIILELLAATGIATAEAKGFEADDVIGTLATREQTDPVEIVTGDRDLFQLVREQPTTSRVIWAGKGIAKAEVYGPAEVAAKYGVPEATAGRSYAEMSMLRGDPSDGLPGVAGIGDKTAAKLITEFGSLAALLTASQDAGDKRIAKGVRAKLLEATDYLAVAPRVVNVATDAPIEQDRDDRLATSTVDTKTAMALRDQWNLGSSVDRLLKALGD
ncbi:5'-3' exonuclease [Pseudonocardiaceae bacterium YIM PH 21723]|nr:5'-3' exonuclease [Pseudonocardiaceae bacterium YIM PH 21723]